MQADAEERAGSGLPDEAAKYAALRGLGNTTLLYEEIRSLWSWATVEQLGQDLRYAFRMMAANRAFTVLAVLSALPGVAHQAGPQGGGQAEGITALLLVPALPHGPFPADVELDVENMKFPRGAAHAGSGLGFRKPVPELASTALCRSRSWIGVRRGRRPKFANSPTWFRRFAARKTR